FGAPQTVTVQNSILRGTSFDLSAVGASPGQVTVNIDHSNYATPELGSGQTINDLGGRQTAAPAFVSAATADFHQVMSSPTIDGGALVAGLGSSDLDGGARVVNSTGSCTALPDIGADEFALSVPPAAGCTPVQSPTATRKCKKQSRAAAAKKRKKRHCKKHKKNPSLED